MDETIPLGGGSWYCYVCGQKEGQFHVPDYTRIGQNLYKRINDVCLKEYKVRLADMVLCDNCVREQGVFERFLEYENLLSREDALRLLDGKENV